MPLEQKSLFQSKYSEKPVATLSSAHDKANLTYAILGFALIPKIGQATLNYLFDSGIFHDLWSWNQDEFLCALKKLKGGISDKITFDLEKIQVAGQAEAKKLQKSQISLIILGDELYPDSLTRLDDPPRWLFVKGSPANLTWKFSAGVIGARECSQEGEQLAYTLAKEMSYRNVAVISGLARGIDQAAHLGAVNHFGKTIAVLGHGFETGISKAQSELVERIIKTEGVIVSEYFPSTPPSRNRYLRRNEILASLSDILFPVECHDLKSGTAATIRRAQKAKIEVIGITLEETNNEFLLKTFKILQSLNCKIFPVLRRDQKSSELWQYLSTKYSKHHWEEQLNLLRDLYFSNIEEQILSQSQLLNLDEESIQRFYERLQSRLKGVQESNI